MSNPVTDLFSDIQRVSEKYDTDFSVLRDEQREDDSTANEVENNEIVLTDEDIAAQEQLSDDIEASCGNY